MKEWDEVYRDLLDAQNKMAEAIASTKTLVVRESQRVVEFMERGDNWQARAERAEAEAADAANDLEMSEMHRRRAEADNLDNIMAALGMNADAARRLREENAALRAQLDAAKAAQQWRPISETPDDHEDTDYLGWDGYRKQIVTYKPDADHGPESWPWFDWYDDDVAITHYQPLPAAPDEEARP